MGGVIIGINCLDKEITKIVIGLEVHRGKEENPAQIQKMIPSRRLIQ